MKSKFDHRNNRIYADVFRCNKCEQVLPLNSPEVNINGFHMPVKPYSCGGKVHVTRKYKGSFSVGKKNRKLDQIRELLNMDVNDFLSMEIIRVGGNIYLLKPEGKTISTPIVKEIGK